MKHSCERLAGTSREKYIEDMSMLVAEYVSELCRIADKYFVNRYSVIEQAAVRLTFIAEAGSFEKMKMEEEE